MYMFKTNQPKETMKYRYDEIKTHFEEWVKYQGKDWIKENIDDLHHHCFNTDYYIIGTYRAKKWLGDEVFNIIDLIKRITSDNFFLSLIHNRVILPSIVCVFVF